MNYALLFALAVRGGADTVPVADTATIPTYPIVAVAADTTKKRPRPIEYSDAYNTRLTIHRIGSYTMLPLFAAEYALGQNLMNGNSPDWVRPAHNAVALGVGALFTVNTVTGVWNLWSTRDQPEGRTKRILHSVLMLASDAGFTYTGIVSTDDTKNSSSARTNHRNWAYASMGTALVGYGIMLIGNN